MSVVTEMACLASRLGQTKQSLLSPSCSYFLSPFSVWQHFKTRLLLTVTSMTRTLCAEYGRGYQSRSSFTQWMIQFPSTTRFKPKTTNPYGLKQCVAIRKVARSRSRGKGLFAALDDDGKSIGWTRGGGGGNGRRVILSMKTAHRCVRLESGCAGNGKSLRLLAFIGTHVSVARPYPHDSLFCVKYQVLVAEGRFARWDGRWLLFAHLA